MSIWCLFLLFYQVTIHNNLSLKHSKEQNMSDHKCQQKVVKTNAEFARPFSWTFRTLPIQEKILQHQSKICQVVRPFLAAWLCIDLKSYADLKVCSFHFVMVKITRILLFLGQLVSSTLDHLQNWTPGPISKIPNFCSFLAQEFHWLEI